MPFTSEFLSAQGLDADKIDVIINAHTEVTDALKSEIEKYRTEAEKVTEIQNQLNNANQKIQDYEKDNYKEKYENLLAENSARELSEKKNSAIRRTLENSGYSAKGIEKILKYGGFSDKTELDENGGIKNVDKFISCVDSEWNEYKETTEIIGAGVAKPPQNPNQKSGYTGIAARLNSEFNSNMYGSVQQNQKN